MFFLIPFRVSERNGAGPPPLANSVLIAANVVVYLLNAWRPLDLAVGPGTPVVTVLTYGLSQAGVEHPARVV